MKTYIFLFFGLILMTLNSHAQLGFICKKTPLTYNKAINCPAAVPAEALHKMFEKNFPNISFQKVTHDNGDAFGVFGTEEHAWYLKTNKSEKIISLEQGLPDSSCYYKYTVEKGSNGLRYCNAEPPKTAGLECLKKHATDPIRNPKNQRKNCDAFLEAMVNCSKTSEIDSCKKTLYSYMNIKDNGRPTPNPNNKPAPESERGLADKKYDGDFFGEPDTGTNTSGSK